MKKSVRLFLNLALASTLFLGYSLVRAQDQNPSAGDQGGAQPAMTAPDHGEGENGRLEHMKKELGLTDAQTAKLKTVMKKEREANKTLWDQVKIDLDTLQQKVDTKASDSDITNVLDKLKSDRKQLREAQENSMERMRSILTPMQQAKMVLMMKDKMGERMGGWKKDGDKPADAAPDQNATPAPNNAQ